METKIINENKKIVNEDIINALKSVFDPEIDFSVYDIGLIYEVRVYEKEIIIVMTLTTINCPEAQTLPESVKNAVQEINPDLNVIVELTFEPEWNVENMSDEVKLRLGLL
jgi:metal-sulfur cluster biosynthetic enzyme